MGPSPSELPILSSDYGFPWSSLGTLISVLEHIKYLTSSRKWSFGFVLFKPTWYPGPGGCSVAHAD